MNNNATIMLVGIGALLVGGISTAAYMNHRHAQTNPIAVESVAVGPHAFPETLDPVDDAPQSEDISVSMPMPLLQYADIVAVEPINERQQQYAAVINTQPITDVVRTSVPREVCQDVAVQEQLPERDGNVGGTVAGALVGGVLGNQVGGGRGKKAATAAGAVAGGIIGNQIDKRHVGGRVVTRTERQCHTENDVSETTHITGYRVTYRNANGTTGTTQMDTKPGARIPMGSAEKTTGYNVTYRYDDQQKTIRMDQKPQGERFPVVDGMVITDANSVASTDTRQ